MESKVKKPAERDKMLTIDNLMDAPQKGHAGLLAVGSKFARCGWVFRDQPVMDIGIDAIVERKHQIAPCVIALQIKAGDYFFREQNDHHVIFRTSLRLIQYWLKFPLPVAIVLFDFRNDTAYWQLVTTDSVTLTGATVKIDIPKNQIVDESCVGMMLSCLNIGNASNDQWKYVDIFAKIQIDDHAAKYAAINSILLKNPYDAIALIIKGNHELAMGYTAAAIDTFTKALLYEPDNADTHIALGSAFLKLGDDEKALISIGRGLAIDPINTTGLHFQSLSQLRTGQVQAAIQGLNTAIEIEPAEGASYSALGWCHVHVGCRDEAISCFEKQIELQPYNPEAHNNLGRAHEVFGEIDSALAAYTKALEVDPEFILAGENLARLEQTKKICVMEQRVKDNPKNPEEQFQLGVLYCDNGDVKKSIDQFNKVLLLSPHDARAWINMAVVKAMNSQFDEALEHLARAEQCGSNLSDVYPNRGWVHFLQKQYDKAIEDYTRSLDKDPTDPVMYYQRALVFKEKFDLTNAIDDLNRALDLSPQLSVARDLRRKLLSIRRSMVKSAIGLYIPNPAMLYY